MTRRDILVASPMTAVALTFGALTACSPLEERLRYRVTLQVETPQGIRTGSGVWEATAQKQMSLGDSSPVAEGLRAEAIAVDLPTGALFALVEPGLTQRVLQTFIPVAGRRVYTVPAMRELSGAAFRNRSTVLSPDDYPRLVRFGDLSDPKSVAAVDPSSLTESFGPGVMLRRITVTITDEPVTVGIEKRLVWLDHLDDYRTDSKNPFTNTLPTEIGGLRSNSK